MWQVHNLNFSICITVDLVIVLVPNCYNYGSYKKFDNMLVFMTRIIIYLTSFYSNLR